MAQQKQKILPDKDCQSFEELTMSEGMPQGSLSSLTSLSILSEDGDVPVTDLKGLEMWLAGGKKNW